VDTRARAAEERELTRARVLARRLLCHERCGRGLGALRAREVVCGGLRELRGARALGGERVMRAYRMRALLGPKLLRALRASAESDACARSASARAASARSASARAASARAASFARRSCASASCWCSVSISCRAASSSVSFSLHCSSAILSRFCSLASSLRCVLLAFWLVLMIVGVVGGSAVIASVSCAETDKFIINGHQWVGATILHRRITSPCFLHWLQMVLFPSEQFGHAVDCFLFLLEGVCGESLRTRVISPSFLTFISCVTYSCEHLPKMESSLLLLTDEPTSGFITNLFWWDDQGASAQVNGASGASGQERKY
jgi:hypothetical protein